MQKHEKTEIFQIVKMSFLDCDYIVAFLCGSNVTIGVENRFQ